MRTILVFLLAIFLLISSFAVEPLQDTLDSFAGATNDTYGPELDSIAGASYENEHEDEDEHEDEHEDEDDD